MAIHVRKSKECDTEVHVSKSDHQSYWSNLVALTTKAYMYMYVHVYITYVYMYM